MRRLIGLVLTIGSTGMAQAQEATETAIGATERQTNCTLGLRLEGSRTVAAGALLEVRPAGGKRDKAVEVKVTRALKDKRLLARPTSVSATEKSCPTYTGWQVFLSSNAATPSPTPPTKEKASPAAPSARTTSILGGAGFSLLGFKEGVQFTPKGLAAFAQLSSTIPIADPGIVEVGARVVGWQGTAQAQSGGVSISHSMSSSRVGVFLAAGMKMTRLLSGGLYTGYDYGFAGTTKFAISGGTKISAPLASLHQFTFGTAWDLLVADPIFARLLLESSLVSFSLPTAEATTHRTGFGFASGLLLGFRW